MKQLTRKREDLIINVLNGNFKEAAEISRKYEYKELSDQLVNKELFKTGSIMPYAFVCYLLQKEETAELHSLASTLLALPLNTIEDAYQAALYHARRAVSMPPKNLEYLKFLLYFYEIPERLIDKEEAKKVSQEILELDASDRLAQGILNSP